MVSYKWTQEIFKVINETTKHFQTGRSRFFRINFPRNFGNFPLLCPAFVPENVNMGPYGKTPLVPRILAGSVQSSKFHRIPLIFLFQENQQGGMNKKIFF
jgi:hypothetical protein